MRILIATSSGRLAVSGLDGPLPEPVRRRLELQLTYKHRQFVRGYQAWDFETGERRAVQAVTKHLYAYDRDGRFQCGAGYLPRLTDLIAGMGHEVEVRDLDPPHPNGDRYALDYDGVYERFEFRGSSQEEMLASLIAAERATVVMPCASGKSFSFKVFPALFPNARIHIITPGLSTQRRVYRDLLREYSCVGVVNGSVKRWNKITVISADSLRHVHGHDPRSFQGADIVLCDEIHELMTENYLEPLLTYRHARIYGFTATLDRFDGAEACAEQVFGPVVFEMTNAEAVALGLIAPIRVEWLPVDVPNPCPDDLACGGDRYLSDTVRDNLCLWSHRRRNEIFAARVRQIPEGTQQLILVDKIEHAMNLKELLPDFRVVYDKIDAGRYQSWVDRGVLDRRRDPLITKKLRLEYQDAFEDGALKKAIATDVWLKAVDFSQLQVLVRADGRASNEFNTQGPGRAQRLSAGKEFGLLIDAADVFHKQYEGRYKRRRASYHRNGWQTIEPAPLEAIKEG